MAKKRRPTRSLVARVKALEGSVRQLARTRSTLKREEHQKMLRMIDESERQKRELETQFARIAQIQAELDEIKRAWLKMKLV